MNTLDTVDQVGFEQLRDWIVDSGFHEFNGSHGNAQVLIAVCVLNLSRPGEATTFSYLNFY